jgi:hypothetical protein
MSNPVASRTWTAFAIAPAVVPIAMLPYFWGLPSAFWIGTSFFIATLFAYIGTLLLGAPTLIALWASGRRGITPTIVIGIVVGSLVWLIFGVLFGLSLGNSIADSVRISFEARALGGLVWPAGICSVLVAITLWLIARPDRETQRDAA